MLSKIISGGQTGADRAALDVAIKYNIPHGGWIPKGRKTEAGPLPRRYALKEMPSEDYPSRTKQNILDSHGTAIICRGPLKGGSALTQSYARIRGKPNIHIDLSMNEAFEASLILQSFIMENGIEVLNLAGPRASHDPGIYFDLKTILESTLYLMFLDREEQGIIGQDLPGRIKKVDFPQGVEQAADLVGKDLSLRARTYIARMKEERLKDLYFVWMEYVRKRVGFDQGNDPLLEACRRDMELDFFSVEDGVMEILKFLKKALEQSHTLRVIK